MLQQGGEGGGGGGNVTNIADALHGEIRNYTLTPRSNQRGDLNSFFNDLRGELEDIVRTEISRRHAIKVSSSAHVQFTRENFDSDEEEQNDAHFNIPALVALASDDISLLIHNIFEGIKSRIESYEGVGSGWVFDLIFDLEITVYTYNPLGGGTFIPTSSKLSIKTWYY